MKLINVLPRFYLSLDEAKDLGNIPARYQRSGKLGYDEDATTLAVNAFLELKENFKVSGLVLGVGNCQFNFSVFLEATALNEDDISLVRRDELTGLLALKLSYEQKLPFIVVDCPISSDLLTDTTLSGAAVAGWFDSSDEFMFDLFPGIRISRNRYSGNDFRPYGESELLLAIRKYIGEGEVIVTNYDLRGKSRMAQAKYSVQAQSGFTGAVTPVLELSNPSIDLLHGVTLIAANTVETLVINLKGEVEVLYETTPKRMNLSKYLLKRNLSSHDDPGRTSQGAYISSATYLNESASRYRLEAVRCTECSSTMFPPRLRCKKCGGITEKWRELSRRAVVYSVTNILKGASPTEFDVLQRLEGEYLVAIVELEDGSKVITQISDAALEEIDIGTPVKMVFRKIYTQDNLDRYGYKFVKDLQKHDSIS